MSSISIKHYELGDSKWWNNFCSQNKFATHDEFNEYLTRFNAEWVDSAEGHYLVFGDEAGLSMFIMRWS